MKGAQILKTRKANSPRHVIARARDLRGNLTASEKILWENLRRRQVAGFRFRRQYPIGRYIADFCCPEIGLVIEVDGGIHESTLEYDANREDDISSTGYTVLRFTNEDVIRSARDVVRRIIDAAEILKNAR